MNPSEKAPEPILHAGKPYHPPACAMRLNLLLLAFALLAAAPAEAQRGPARRAARSVSTAPAADATVTPIDVNRKRGEGPART